jgi:hypothetical protein
VLEAGGEVRDVELHLAAAGAIEGRVLRADGKPVAGAQIECRSVGQATSDPDGVSRVRGLRPGSTWLRAVIGRECSPWTPVTVAADEAARADLVVAPGTVVLLEVEDANGPVAEAAVTLGDESAPSAFHGFVRTGKARVGPVPPGTYPVTVRRDWRGRDGRSKVESTVTLQGEPEQVLRLRLP